MNENTKIILLNGLPRVGKDYAAKLISEKFDIPLFRFADELKNMVHRSYGLVNVEPDHFENVKDISQSAFNGVKPRDAYISFAENHIKRLHDKFYFVNYVIDKINKEQVKCCIISDLGFSEEIDKIRENFLPRNTLLMQIYSSDENKDSRKYIETIDDNGNIIFPGMLTAKVYNRKDKFYEDQVLNTSANFLNINTNMENDNS